MLLIYICYCTVLLCIVGNYMQMMMVLKPIAFDVVICMTQLFDYYLYSVHIHVIMCVLYCARGFASRLGRGKMIMLCAVYGMDGSSHHTQSTRPS